MLRFAELLATDAVARGLLGPREVPRLWERHLLNCAALAEVVPRGARVADVGSGAGLPGIALALARPDAVVTLIEPLLRRTRFLTDTAKILALAEVEVLRARAEELHGEREFDVVTSRAVAPLDRLAQWSMPLVAPDGVMLAVKGSSVRTELAAARPVLRRLGCGAPEQLHLGEGRLTVPTVVIRVPWGPRRGYLVGHRAASLRRSSAAEVRVAPGQTQPKRQGP